MERISEKKFNQLSDEQMNTINGGGWVVDVTSTHVYPDGTIQSFTIFEYHFLGIPTGRYKESRDYC